MASEEEKFLEGLIRLEKEQGLSKVVAAYVLIITKKSPDQEIF